MSRSKVAVLSTTPETVREDLERLLRLLNVERVLARAEHIRILPDLCRSQFHPSTGTTPWQLDGVLSTLGFLHVVPSRLCLTARDAPGVDASRALDSHALGAVVRKHGFDVEYVRSSSDFLPLGSLTEEPLAPEILREVTIPAQARGSGLVLLPSLRTRPGPWVGGAVSTWARWVWPDMPALPPDRWHACMAQLAGLLRAVAPFTLSVMDATVSGDGAGPRQNHPTVQNVLLASLDPVAIDAVGARLMGLNPRGIDFFRLCEHTGAGRGDPSHIEIVGEDVGEVDFGFTARRTIANFNEGPASGQWGDRLMAGRLGQFLASMHERLWWEPVVARRERRLFQQTPWGLLFREYASGGVDGGRVE